ncbi:ATP12 family chaperone protein [Pararhizobium sp. IMCC21322]|uniref:ATP12 family chaperone protein n=1 Tax=Pararhizobium sp. IMCC21322 TaxID=3067903 RepID=UPI002741F0B2|nr:ATP12 family protein [Pararhizobium sp. IMCC21322]
MADTLDPIETDPVKRAQVHSAPQLPKRFYKEATMAERDGAYHLLLDGRSARTPGKNPLAVKNEAFANGLAKDWNAQKDSINPATMPFTRLANSAIDGVAIALDPVAEEVSNFAKTDLLFYRAGQPEELVALQSQHWDPLLDHFKTRHQARFLLAEGIMYVEQPEDSVARISELISAYKKDPLCLAGLQVMTSIAGSVLIALAVAKNVLSVDAAWQAAHVDEDWNVSQWGSDEEAQARRMYRRNEFDVAHMAAAALSDE